MSFCASSMLYSSLWLCSSCNNEIYLTVCFLPKIALAICGLCVSSWILDCSYSSVNNAFGILLRIAVTVRINFGSYNHFTMLILLVQEHGSSSSDVPWLPRALRYIGCLLELLLVFFICTLFLIGLLWLDPGDSGGLCFGIHLILRVLHHFLPEFFKMRFVQSPSTYVFSELNLTISCFSSLWYDKMQGIISGFLCLLKLPLSEMLSVLGVVPCAAGKLCVSLLMLWRKLLEPVDLLHIV